MNKHNNISGDYAMLTQQELFNRFLETPIRVWEVVSASTLENKELKTRMAEPREYFSSFCMNETLPSPTDFFDETVEMLRDEEDPSGELQMIIENLAGLQLGFERMKDTFDRLRQVTAAVDDDESLSISEHRPDDRYIVSAA